MIRAAMEGADLTLFPSLSLALFLIWFTLAFFWIYRKNSKQTYERLSLLPLEKDTVHLETHNKRGKSQ